MWPLKRTKGGKKRRKKERKKRVPGARWAPFLALYTLEGVRSRAFVHSSASLSLSPSLPLSLSLSPPLSFEIPRKKSFRGGGREGRGKRNGFEVGFRRKTSAPRNRFSFQRIAFIPAGPRILRFLDPVFQPSHFPLSSATLWDERCKDNSFLRIRVQEDAARGRDRLLARLPPSSFRGTLSRPGFPRPIKSLLSYRGRETKKISAFLFPKRVQSLSVKTSRV